MVSLLSVSDNSYSVVFSLPPKNHRITVSDNRNAMILINMVVGANPTFSAKSFLFMFLSISIFHSPL